MSIEERSRERRRRIMGNRARSWADAERWDLEFWQSLSPEERLSTEEPPERRSREER